MRLVPMLVLIGFGALHAVSCIDTNSRRVCGAGVAGVGNDIETSPGCASLAQTSTAPNQPTGVASGIEQCDAQSLDRKASVACALCVDVVVCRSDTSACASCSANEICAEGSLGSCFCAFVCERDEDCGDGFACLCPVDGADGTPSNLYPECVEAECRTNDDCGAGGRCGVGIDGCGSPNALRCRSDVDECAGASDCGEAGRCRAFDDRFRCEPRAECG